MNAGRHANAADAPCRLDILNPSDRNLPPNPGTERPPAASNPLRDTRLTMGGRARDPRADSLEWRDFQRELCARTPRIYLTVSIVAANVLVFALMVSTGAGLVEPSTQSLLAWGADFGPLTLGGQWWRLLSSNYVHIGVIHLACNLLALWRVGELVERLVGNITLAAGGLALVAIGFVLAPRTALVTAELQAIFRDEHAARDAFRKNGSGTLSDSEFAAIIEKQVLPVWTALRTRLEKLPVTQAPQTAFVDLFDRYLATLQDAARLLAEGARTGQSKTSEANARLEEAREISARMGRLSAWR